MRYFFSSAVANVWRITYICSVSSNLQDAALAFALSPRIADNLQLQS